MTVILMKVIPCFLFANAKVMAKIDAKLAEAAVLTAALRANAIRALLMTGGEGEVWSPRAHTCSRLLIIYNLH